ncbi:MAG: NrfA- nitrite reduction protein [Phycisphaera sp.]|nr:NrfA- nitrite reduction protein [Phycisphaera sp.]
MKKKALVWIGWLVGSLLMVAYLTNLMRNEGSEARGPMIDRTAFIPGQTTDGHYQIEIKCNVCHTAGEGVRQDACIQCHGAELEAAADSHPAKKFKPLDKVHLVERLDALHCVTCHVEHRPTMTRPMGVTMPLDYCAHCHETIQTERPSHAGLSFQTCATAGCHNFHDNRGLNEPFLTAHLNDPDSLETMIVPARSAWRTNHPDAGSPAKPLTEVDQDAPRSVVVDSALTRAWVETAHARAGVNCTDCHRDPSDASLTTGKWVDKPTHESCKRCHEGEVAGFLGGRHGMRLAQGLSPMTPGMARLPMHAEAAHRELSCVSCHNDHEFDTRFAAMDACVQCHDDGHTRSYAASPHAKLWRDEVAGKAPAGSGVSCATCHMPRETHRADGVETVTVQHNQNDNLRPNEKMLHNVCIRCHGVEFAIEALADPSLIGANFKGVSAVKVDSLDMIRAKLAEIERKRAGRKPTQN